MKIMIDIDKDVYTRLFDNGIQDNEIAVDDVCEMARALRLGTPLEVQPCEDCISREAVIEGLANIAKAKAKSDAQKSMMGRCMFFVEQLPPVTPERPKGKWNISVYETGDGQGLFECSNCGETDFYYDKKYCPNCGAEMED